LRAAAIIAIIVLRGGGCTLLVPFALADWRESEPSTRLRERERVRLVVVDVVIWWTLGNRALCVPAILLLSKENLPPSPQQQQQQKLYGAGCRESASQPAKEREREALSYFYNRGGGGAASRQRCIIIGTHARQASGERTLFSGHTKTPPFYFIPCVCASCVELNPLRSLALKMRAPF